MSLESPTRSLFLINFITGISDGLVLPLAACMIALPFFGGRPLMIAATGVVLALLGASVFGWARYKGEEEEIHHKHPELGLEEAERELALLKNIGIDDALTESMKVEMEQERALWLKEIRENELGWEQHDKKRACRSAIDTAAGFFTGGILVALPFAVVSQDLLSLLIPLVWALLCMVLQGWLKGRITGRNPAGAAMLSGLRGVAIMIIAGLLAWIIFRLQRG